MNRYSVGGLISLVMVGLSACSGADDQGEDDAEDVGVAEDELQGSNALTPNALTPNALTPNALEPSSLAARPLSPKALTSDVQSAIKDPGEAGELSREFLRYAVSCALGPKQSFSFTWTDAAQITHDEVYPGMLGLATSWATKPLGSVEQSWISACLAARTNWYGATVMVSMRAAHPALDKPSRQEMTAYHHDEGAFWGNLFTKKPSIKACYYNPERGYSRSKLRDCAAGHLNDDGTVSQCGPIVIAGACDTLCSAFKSSGGYWVSCGGKAAITTFLP